MTLIQQIKASQVEARKTKNELKASTLTTLIGEAEMIGKNAGNRETTDSEVIAVVKKFIKNIDETSFILSKEADKHSTKISALQEEKNILQSFLPKQMSEDEIRAAIKDIVADGFLANPKGMVGIVMKTMKEKHDGNY